MRQRKLLTEKQLHDCWRRSVLGVPYRRILREEGLDMSLPSFISLVKLYDRAAKDDLNRERIRASLFPVWVTPEDHNVQLQPDTWEYIGKYPLGEWRLIT